MRRIAATALILAAALGFAAPSQAQGIAPNGVVFGQSWSRLQDLSSQQPSPRARTAQVYDLAAARAARQAQFNQNFPGTPVQPAAAQGK